MEIDAIYKDLLAGVLLRDNLQGEDITIALHHLYKSYGRQHINALIQQARGKDITEIPEPHPEPRGRPRTRFGKTTQSRKAICTKCKHLKRETCLKIRRDHGCSACSRPWEIRSIKCPENNWPQ